MMKLRLWYLTVITTIFKFYTVSYLMLIVAVVFYIVRTSIVLIVCLWLIRMLIHICKCLIHLVSSLQIRGRHCSWGGRTSCSRCCLYEYKTIQSSFGCKWQSSSFWLWAFRDLEEAFMSKSSISSRRWLFTNPFMYGLYNAEPTLHCSWGMGAIKEVAKLILGWWNWYICRIRCLEFRLYSCGNVHWFHPVRDVLLSMFVLVE